MKISTGIKLSVSIAILSFLVYSADVNKVITSFLLVNPFILLLVIPIKISTMFLNALNISLLFRALKIKVGYYRLLVYSNLAVAVGLVLPSKIGELSLAYFLKKFDIGYGESTSVAILDKMITFFVLSIVSAAGIFFYYNLASAIQLIILCIFIIIGATVILLNEKVRLFIRRRILKKHSKLFQGFSYSMKHILSGKRLLFYNILLTLIKWSLSFLVIKVIFMSMGISMEIMDAIFITAIAIIVGLVPISIAGLGVREGIAVVLFMRIGMAQEITLSVYLINTIINYLFSFVFTLFHLDKFTLKKYSFSGV